MPVPGIAGLDTGGDSIGPLACPAAGTCTAVGSYLNSAGQVFFDLSEVHHRWGRPRPIPGLPAFGQAAGAAIGPLSCPSTGDCSVAGSYEIGSDTYPFLVSQAHGIWGRAAKIPSLAVLARSGYSQILALSCGAAGNCSAGGYYLIARGSSAFVVGQTNGHWHRAHQVAANIGG